MRTKRLGGALLGVLAVILLGTTAHADDRRGAWDGWWPSDPIEGLWDVTVTITPPPPSPGADCPAGPVLATFKALALFARGGSFHDLNESGKAGPFPRAPGLGIWQRKRSRHYSFDVKSFVYELGAVAPAGWTIVRHDVVLAEDGQSYVSAGTAENFTADGAVIQPGLPGRPPLGCSKSTAVRFR